MEKKLFSDLLASVRQGAEILRGEREPSRRFEVRSVDVKRIRQGYKMSQAQFALMLGISLGTLRNWEQGRRSPEGPARVLLQVAARYPREVWETVRDAAHSETSPAA